MSALIPCDERGTLELIYLILLNEITASGSSASGDGDAAGGERLLAVAGVYVLFQVGSYCTGKSTAAAPSAWLSTTATAAPTTESPLSTGSSQEGCTSPTPTGPRRRGPAPTRRPALLRPASSCIGRTGEEKVPEYCSIYRRARECSVIYIYINLLAAMANTLRWIRFYIYVMIGSNGEHRLNSTVDVVND